MEEGLKGVQAGILMAEAQRQVMMAEAVGRLRMINPAARDQLIQSHLDLSNQYAERAFRLIGAERS